MRFTQGARKEECDVKVVVKQRISATESGFEVPCKFFIPINNALVIKFKGRRYRAQLLNYRRPVSLLPKNLQNHAFYPQVLMRGTPIFCDGPFMIFIAWQVLVMRTLLIKSFV